MPVYVTHMGTRNIIGRMDDDLARLDTSRNRPTDRPVGSSLLLGYSPYLVSCHSSEAGPGHLSDTSSTIRRLLDRMPSSFQEG